MSTTYTDLSNDIKSFSGRTDPQTINAIPKFINAAQTELDSTLRVPAMLVTQNIKAEGLSVPLTLLEVQSVIIGEIEGILVPYADVLAKRKVSTRLPFSTIYAMNGSNIELVEPADLIITGYQKPERISSSVASNAYTAQAENALLFLSLKYLGVFARDAKSSQGWGDMGAAEVENLNAAAEKFMSATGVSNERQSRYF
ncbi:phage adaptor protein [Enterobacter cloacae]|uniref:phage adaptor protein n=1 Tax=Enterobacter cloacae TaxID=550 RepID=UPI003EDFA315